MGNKDFNNQVCIWKHTHTHEKSKQTNNPPPQKKQNKQTKKTKQKKPPNICVIKANEFSCFVVANLMGKSYQALIYIYIGQHWFRYNGMPAVWHQTITWTCAYIYIILKCMFLLVKGMF